MDREAEAKARLEPELAAKNKTSTIGGIIGGIVVLLLVGGVLWVACLNHGRSRAKDNFASSFTCPADRIEMRERYDIKGAMFVEHPPIPDEVKKDPGRLALWQKKEADRESDANNGGNYGQYYWQVHGCGHDVLYECSNKPSCHDRKFPAGVSSAW